MKQKVLVKSAARIMGANDAARVLWAIGKSFHLFFVFFQHQSFKIGTVYVLMGLKVI